MVRNGATFDHQSDEILGVAWIENPIHNGPQATVLGDIALQRMLARLDPGSCRPPQEGSRRSRRDRRCVARPQSSHWPTGSTDGLARKIHGGLAGVAQASE